MKRAFWWILAVAAMASCSRLPALTESALTTAEHQWDAHKPAAYHMVLIITGDRVETGRFEVDVLGGRVVSLRRNGLVIRPNAGQDYTMEGLFHMLAEEIGLAEKPTMLGAPPGYTVYTTAKFDSATGRLIRYRRTVGGAANSVDINVVEYQESP